MYSFNIYTGLDFRNLVPENLFQALFQHIYTAYDRVNKMTNLTTLNNCDNCVIAMVLILLGLYSFV